MLENEARVKVPQFPQDGGKGDLRERTTSPYWDKSFETFVSFNRTDMINKKIRGRIRPGVPIIRGGRFWSLNRLDRINMIR